MYLADDLRELETIAAQLLERAQKLPPGQLRQDALKEAGRFRARINALRQGSDARNRGRCQSRMRGVANG